MSLQQKLAIKLMKESHLSANLINVPDTKIEQKVQGFEMLQSVENVKDQAVQVTQAAKWQDKGVEEMINGILTTREMVRLISNSTKKQV